MQFCGEDFRPVRQMLLDCLSRHFELMEGVLGMYLNTEATSNARIRLFWVASARLYDPLRPLCCSVGPPVRPSVSLSRKGCHLVRYDFCWCRVYGPCISVDGRTDRFSLLHEFINAPKKRQTDTDNEKRGLWQFTQQQSAVNRALPSWTTQHYICVKWQWHWESSNWWLAWLLASFLFTQRALVTILCRTWFQYLEVVNH